MKIYYYVIINRPWGDAIGNFDDYSKAFRCFMNCFSDGLDVQLRAMTEEEYHEYFKKRRERKNK